MGLLTKPRQTVLITTRGEVEVLGKKVFKNNIITIDWHMPCSHEPQLYAISIGKSRFSYKLINESKVFVVNFISKDLEKPALYCGTHQGDHVDKFKESELTIEDCEKVDCGRVKQALGYLECEVIEEVDSGDHVIFIGKVLHTQLKENDKRLFHLGNHKFGTSL